MIENEENSEQDLALVKGCLEDDRTAQEALYRKYAPQMYGVCMNYAKDRDQAMDFLQDGFIEVYRKIESYRGEGALGGWIRRVIIYRTIDALRKEKRYQEVIRLAEHEQEVLPEDFELDNVQNGIDKIRELVDTLPGKAALVLKLYVLEGLTHQEIAEYLEISVGTSKSQLNRARTLLKASLQSE